MDLEMVDCQGIEPRGIPKEAGFTVRCSPQCCSQSDCFCMAPPERFELPTPTFEASCSCPAELGRLSWKMVALNGFEPLAKRL